MTCFSKSGLFAGLALAFSGLAAQAKNVTLRYSNWLPAGYALDVKVMEPWFADIARHRRPRDGGKDPEGGRHRRVAI